MIEILDSNFYVVDFLREYTYATYMEELRGLGSFSIDVQVCDNTLFLLSKKEQYYVLFDNEVLGVVESINHTTDNEYSNAFTITGKLSNVLLNRRVIDRTLDVNAYASEYISTLLNTFYGKEAKTEQKVAYELVGYPYSLSSSAWGKYNVKHQVTGGYVWDEIVDILNEFKIGIKVRPVVYAQSDGDPKVIRWRVTIIDGYDYTKNGTVSDRARGVPSIILSQSLSNLAGGTYSRDVKALKNIAIVAGEGEGSDRKILRTQINSDVPENKNATGFSLNELWIDARDLQKEQDGTTLTDEEYINLLINRANTKAEENTVNESYESTMTQRNDLYQYGKDYNLGDWVTVEDRDLQVTVDAQVVSFTKTYQGSNVITDIGLSYGKVETNPVEKISNNITVTQGQQVSIGYLENETKKAQDTAERVDLLTAVPKTTVYPNAQDIYKLKSIIAGSVVRNGTGSASVLVFTRAQVLKMFGLVSGTGYAVQFTFMNGDGGASSVHYEGCTYQNSAYYLVGSSSFGTGNMRINFIGYLFEVNP